MISFTAMTNSQPSARAAVDPGTVRLALELHDGQWLLIASAKDDEPVNIRPFDAVTFSLGDLWAGGASVQRPA